MQLIHLYGNFLIRRYSFFLPNSNTIRLRYQQHYGIFRLSKKKNVSYIEYTSSSLLLLLSIVKHLIGEHCLFGAYTIVIRLLSEFTVNYTHSALSVGITITQCKSWCNSVRKTNRSHKHRLLATSTKTMGIAILCTHNYSV